MGILDFLSGQFIDVIHWTDDTQDTMVWRFERAGHEIKYGAKLTVREGQAAVFVHEGQMADVFTPGLYMLETNNMPIMTTLQHWDHGFKSPFKSEIYFVDTTRFTGLKWGTKNPGKLIAEAINPTIAQYGIMLPELYIENISLPPAVEKALDTRTSRGIAGNLDEHMKYQAAQAMGAEGSAAGQAMGMGMGAGLGMNMGQMFQPSPWGQAPQQQAAPAAMAPPPLNGPQA